MIFVCTDMETNAERIVRHGFRLAYRLKAEWHVAFVSSSSPGTEVGEDPAIQRIKKLTKTLGGEFDLLPSERSGGGIAGALLKRADELNATQIILGQPRKGGFRLTWRPKIGPRLIRQSIGRDVLIVSRNPKD